MVGWLAQEGGPINAVFGSFEDTALWVIFGISLVALLFAWYLVREVLRAPEGTDKMKEIAKAIQEGASAYLSRQFRTVAVFLVVLAVVIFFLLPVPANAAHSEASIRFGRSIAFILGAFFSAITGYIGMWLAVRANVRTANAARESGLRAVDADRVPRRRRGRHVHGRARSARRRGDPDHLQGGRRQRAGRASGSAARCSRCSCGWAAASSRRRPTWAPTWSARSSRASPRTTRATRRRSRTTSATTSGDCAGMAADLFESSEVTLIASLILGAAAYAGSPQGAIIGVMFPLFVRAIGVVTSMIGILAVTPRSEDEHGMKAINRGFFVSAIVSAIAVLILSGQYMDSYKPAIAVIIGLVLASVIQVLTQYFTDTKYRPVQEIAEATVTGPATTILSGFSIGLESTVWSALIVGAAMICVVLPGRERPTPGAVLHLADRHGHAHDGRRDRVDGHVRSDLGQRAGHRRDVRRVRGPAGRDPDRPGRDRELHEGDHEGHRDRDRRHRGDLAVRFVRGGAAYRLRRWLRRSPGSVSTGRTCWSDC